MSNSSDNAFFSTQLDPRNRSSFSLCDRFSTDPSVPYDSRDWERAIKANR